MRLKIAILAVIFTSCASVLGLTYRSLREPFAHRAHLVGGVGCSDCHAGVGRAEDEGPLHLPTAARCVECHARPHDPRPCMDCHGSVGAEARALDARLHLKFSHQAHLPVMKGNCARCHEVAETLSPKMGTCLGCHEHQDAWDERRCEQCHQNLPAESVRPASHVVHSADYLARHGVDAASSRELCATCHSEQSCARCHSVSAPVLDARARFNRPDQARLHPAGFGSRHALEARAQPGTCTSCHAIESCAECHEVSEVGATGALRRGPHPPGWVGITGNAHGPAARLDPMGCASCHGGAGEKLCVDCHKVGGVGGSPHPPGWSSAKPLSQAPCRLCHLGAGP